jgi:hypothetical protein
MIFDLFSCWLLWIMIYYAQRTYPIIGRFEAAYVAEMRDLIACNDIIAQDDILSEKDAPLFLKIIQILDFLYFTLMPALMTWMGVYNLRVCSHEVGG